MMSSTLGAPLGGTTRGGHHVVESLASCLMTPPNFGGGGGICLPSMLVVALGEPGVPRTCCPEAGTLAASIDVRNMEITSVVFPQDCMSALVILFFLPCHRSRCRFVA